MQRTNLTHGRGWLDAPAAASLARMDAARGDWLRTTSTGRERHEQEEAYAKYLAGGSFAALPGRSPHEPGLAADFHAREWAWLLQHGEAHGWFLTIASEPWHRVYRAHKDQHINDTDESEDPMRYLLQIDPKTDGRWYLADFGAGTAQRIDNGAQLDLIRRDPRVNQVAGPQPRTILARLKTTGE